MKRFKKRLICMYAQSIGSVYLQINTNLDHTILDHTILDHTFVSLEQHQSRPHYFRSIPIQISTILDHNIDMYVVRLQILKQFQIYKIFYYYRNLLRTITGVKFEKSHYMPCACFRVDHVLFFKFIKKRLNVIFRF